MCGTEGQMFKVLVEGTEMSVCGNCSKFGKVKTRIKTKEDLKRDFKRKQSQEEVSVIKKPETIFIIVDDYAARVKKAREKMNLKQEEVAKRIAEKESLLHNIESGNFEPSQKTARKLESFFNIKLVEQHKEEHKGYSRKTNGSMTLGDMIKFKTR